MKTYDKLRAEFDRKVAWLRKHCKHEFIPVAYGTAIYGCPDLSSYGRRCPKCSLFQAEIPNPLAFTANATSNTLSFGFPGDSL